MTTPRLDCYPSEAALHQHDAEIELLGLPFEKRPNLTAPTTEEERSWYRTWDAHSQAMSDGCFENGNVDMLRSMSTSFAARDMLAILDELGQKDLVYWGFSYGTLIGATFGAMFPDRVGRLVNDGVSDATLHGTDLYARDMRSLIDNDKVYRGFLDSCVAAGLDRCALAHPNVTSTSLSNTIDDLLISLINSPLPISSHNSRGILTASSVKNSIFRLSLYELGHPPSHPLPAYDDNVFNKTMFRTGDPTSSRAVVCGDSDPLDSSTGAPDSLDRLIDLAHELEKIAPMGGEGWALSHTGGCRHWGVRGQAVESFKGPWTNLTQTKFPIIFLSNTADPVTPLKSGRHMAEVFGPKSAALLIQDSFGHCSSSTPSTCTARVLRDYFNNGIVPISETICVADPDTLFPSSHQMNAAKLDDDSKLRAALLDLSRIPAEY
ncbi:hypothetical protein RQP46_008630 [Phenoliferia psychrophenolica]